MEDDVPLIHQRRRRRIVRADHDVRETRARLRARIEARYRDDNESEHEKMTEINGSFPFQAV
jgi:hypothetical protein